MFKPGQEEEEDIHEKTSFLRDSHPPLTDSTIAPGESFELNDLNDSGEDEAKVSTLSRFLSKNLSKDPVPGDYTSLFNVYCFIFKMYLKCEV